MIIGSSESTVRFVTCSRAQEKKARQGYKLQETGNREHGLRSRVQVEGAERENRNNTCSE